MNVVTEPATTVLILYGSSPLLDTVEIMLRQNGSFPITRLSVPHAPLQLNNVPKGTIIYDQDQIDPTAVYQLLTDYPGWQLIGLTASSADLLIINSEKKNGRFLADSINTINTFCNAES